MAGTTNKKDTPAKSEDAPKLVDIPPEEEFAPVEETPTASAEDNSVSRVFVTLDVPNVAKAKDVDAVPRKEGQPDPSLVAIPGLGQFRNGTTTEIDAVQLLLFQQHYAVTNIDKAQLPVGVAIEMEGE